MGKINLPSEMLQKEAFRLFPAKGKEEYLSNLLKKLLDLNPEGLTISRIREATALPYSTIWHHLEVLSCTAQCRKVAMGNTNLYYPHGRDSHLNEHNKGKVCYSISTVENENGKFICIHEKEENRTGIYTVFRGIDIPIELIDEVIETLRKSKQSS